MVIKTGKMDMLVSLLALAPSTSVIPLRHWAVSLLCSNAQIILHFTQSKKKEKNLMLHCLSLLLQFSTHPLVLGTHSGLPLLLTHTLCLTQSLCTDWPFFPECSSRCYMACPVALCIVGLCSDTASQRGFSGISFKNGSLPFPLEHSPPSLSGSNFFFL